MPVDMNLTHRPMEEKEGGRNEGGMEGGNRKENKLHPLYVLLKYHKGS